MYLKVKSFWIWRTFYLVPPVHWTRCDHDTCPFSDTCHDHSGFSVTGHWTFLPLFLFFKNKNNNDQKEKDDNNIAN